MTEKDKLLDLGINKDVFQDRLASIIVWFFFFGVLPALFLAYVWIGFKVFDYITDLLNSGFLASIISPIIVVTAAMGSYLFLARLKDWWIERNTNGY
jgi:hypothetical protein